MKNWRALALIAAVSVTLYVAAACVPPRAPEVAPVQKPCAVSPAQSVVLGNFVSEYLEGEIWNNLDDNGNGIADEQGLCMTYDEDSATLMIRITIQQVGEKGRVSTSTVQTAVRIRNTRNPN